MKQIAFMFSGQGSQYVGMSKDLYEQFDSVKQIFNQAETITGYPLKDIIFHEDKRLHETKYTQVCMFTLYQAILSILNKYQIDAKYSLGLSLGEYGAYLHNQVFDFETGLKIVRERALLMDKASNNHPGKMSAIMGFDIALLEKIIKDSHSLVTIANYNTPGQIVISGESHSVDAINELVKNAGAKRVIELNTSGAFHSSLMSDASIGLSNYLKEIKLNEPQKQLFINLTGKAYESNIKDVMTKQITHSVKFYQMIENLIDEGVDTFIEVGPKRTLCNFVKRINRQVKTLNIENIESLINTLNDLEVKHEIIS
ncbi:MAG: ACP S-malonyltransferase [Tenericutes bacterium]|jgi:[acyl-carrier-protein] S-malonyltransferase|nr:ACP S-malonyltransferase [Mycoplasmatota bacterium]